MSNTTKDPEAVFFCELQAGSRNFRGRSGPDAKAALRYLDADLERGNPPWLQASPQVKLTIHSGGFQATLWSGTDPFEGNRAAIHNHIQKELAHDPDRIRALLYEAAMKEARAAQPTSTEVAPAPEQPTEKSVALGYPPRKAETFSASLTCRGSRGSTYQAFSVSTPSLALLALKKRLEDGEAAGSIIPDDTEVEFTLWEYDKGGRVCGRRHPLIDTRQAPATAVTRIQRICAGIEAWRGAEAARTIQVVGPPAALLGYTATITRGVERFTGRVATTRLNAVYFLQKKLEVDQGEPDVQSRQSSDDSPIPPIPFLSIIPHWDPTGFQPDPTWLGGANRWILPAEPGASYGETLLVRLSRWIEENKHHLKTAIVGSMSEQLGDLGAATDTTPNVAQITVPYKMSLGPPPELGTIDYPPTGIATSQVGVTYTIYHSALPAAYLVCRHEGDKNSPSVEIGHIGISIEDAQAGKPAWFIPTTQISARFLSWRGAIHTLSLQFDLETKKHQLHAALRMATPPSPAEDKKFSIENGTPSGVPTPAAQRAGSFQVGSTTMSIGLSATPEPGGGEKLGALPNLALLATARIGTYTDEIGVTYTIASPMPPVYTIFRHEGGKNAPPVKIGCIASTEDAKADKPWFIPDRVGRYLSWGDAIHALGLQFDQTQTQTQTPEVAMKDEQELEDITAAAIALGSAKDLGAAVAQGAAQGIIGAANKRAVAALVAMEGCPEVLKTEAGQALLLGLLPAGAVFAVDLAPHFGKNIPQAGLVRQAGILGAQDAGRESAAQAGAFLYSLLLPIFAPLWQSYAEAGKLLAPHLEADPVAEREKIPALRVEK